MSSPIWYYLLHRSLWCTWSNWKHYHKMGYPELDSWWLCGKKSLTFYSSNHSFLNATCYITKILSNVSSKEFMFTTQTDSWHFFPRQARVTIFNYQQYRHIESPGWQLGWTWLKKEVIWNMVGAQATEQGDCSKFKGDPPHCCKKTPTVVDLLPGTPYNHQISNCCRGGVVSAWAQDSATAVSAFQISVGQSGTTNTTVRAPRNITLKAPGPGYTCGPAKTVAPTKFFSDDKRRKTQAMCKFRGFKVSFQVMFYFLASNLTFYCCYI